MAKRSPNEEHERDDSPPSEDWRERRRSTDPRYRTERAPQRSGAFESSDREDEQYASFRDSPRRDAGWPFDDEGREARPDLRGDPRRNRRTESTDDEYRGPASAERRYGAGGFGRRQRAGESGSFGGTGRSRDERFGGRADDDERPSDEERYGSMSGREADEDDRPYYRGYYRSSATPLSWPGGSGSLVSESWTITGPHTGKGPKGYRRSKEQIVEEASQRLQQSGRIDASNIDVSCDNGVLTLRGTVEDRRMKRAAEECVESISGVEDVANELRVQRVASQDPQERGDQTGHRPKTGL